MTPQEINRRMALLHEQAATIYPPDSARHIAAAERFRIRAKELQAGGRLREVGFTPIGSIVAGIMERLNTQAKAVRRPPEELSRLMTACFNDPRENQMPLKELRQ